jgi:sulfur carrier protein ThiS
MQVLLLNNDGAGFADYIEIDTGTTIEQMLGEQLPHRGPDELLIRVNRQPVARDHVLQPNDRVSATPVKIEGAGLEAV